MLCPTDVSGVSTPPTENSRCETFALSGRKTRVMFFFTGLAFYTGAFCPKEEQVLLLEAKALKRKNCLKVNPEFSISS